MPSSTASDFPGVFRIMLEWDPISDSITGDEECPELGVMVTANLALRGLNTEDLFTFRLKEKFWGKTDGVGVGGGLTGFAVYGEEGLMIAAKGKVSAWKTSKLGYSLRGNGMSRWRRHAATVCICPLAMKLGPHKMQFFSGARKITRRQHPAVYTDTRTYTICLSQFFFVFCAICFSYRKTFQNMKRRKHGK